MDISLKIEQLKEKSRFARECFEFIESIGKAKIGRNASSISFYAFISMIPLFILLCAQLPFTGISANQLQSAIEEITPDVVHELVASVISEAYTSRMAIFSISAVFLIWASSKAMLAVIQSLDMVYDVDKKRNYFKTIGFAVFYTLSALIIIGAFLTFYAKSHTIEEMISTAFPTKELFRQWARRGHNIISLIVLTLLFSLLYKFAPSGKRKLAYQLPGALFSAIVNSFFSIFFAIYNNRGNIYKSFYGSLTANAIFLVWLYFCVMIMLIGGVINNHYSYEIEKSFKKLFRRKKRFR